MAAQLSSGYSAGVGLGPGHCHFVTGGAPGEERASPALLHGTTEWQRLRVYAAADGMVHFYLNGVLRRSVRHDSIRSGDVRLGTNGAAYEYRDMSVLAQETRAPLLQVFRSSRVRNVQSSSVKGSASASASAEDRTDSGTQRRSYVGPAAGVVPLHELLQWMRREAERRDKHSRRFDGHEQVLPARARAPCPVPRAPCSVVDKWLMYIVYISYPQRKDS